MEHLFLQNTSGGCFWRCCWISEAAAQLPPVKMRFCKASQISQKTSKIISLFRKAVTSQPCNCYTKKDTITGVFLWIYLCEYNFSFLLFCFRKNKSSHRRCSVKKDEHMQEKIRKLLETLNNGGHPNLLKPQPNENFS